MRFLEIPALITEDIEVPDIVDITEPITASISGTTLTIDGGNKVSGEATITLTGDVTVNTINKSNLRQPSIHKISVKTNGVGNFTYTPNTGVTASSVSSTIKTGSDFEILLITTSGGDTYLDLDLADYTSPAVNFDNVLTGFDITDLTSTYGATAKLYKPDGTLLTTVSSAGTGSAVGFGSGVETTAQAVTYKLEVTDDVGRKSTYNLPRKWISYAMETTTTPGFQKFKLGANEYTSTTVVPNLSSTTKARVYKTSDHGYLGINFKIQGRNSTSGAWTDIDSTAENVESDESAEFLAFGDYIYHRVWVKPTAQASTSVTSDGVVTLTLSNVTEDVTTTTISGKDPYSIDETSNAYIFDETAKFGSVPLTITLGSETYSNATTATVNQIGTTPNTDMTAAGPNMKHEITTSSLGRFHEVSGDGKYIAWANTSGVIQVMKGDPENGYTNYTTFTHSQSTKNDLFGSISYDGKYIMNGCNGVNQHHEIWKHDESAGTYSKISQTATEIGGENRLHKPSFVPAKDNYDFAVTGTDNNSTFRIQMYKHTAGTDTWTTQTEIVDPTDKPSGDGGRGRYGKQFTSDGKYLMVSSTGSYGGYEMYTIDWSANTAKFSGARRSANDNIGHSGTVTLDGKYVLIFHNDSNSRLIFKNNDAGDWSSATDVTSDFTFVDADNDQGHDISFCGENSEYFLSGMQSGNLRMYSWYGKKELTLTYNSKDRLTFASKGGLTTTSVKLYKDGTLYHTFGDETIVFIDETGVYQAVADDTYYSNKVTVTVVTETKAQLCLSTRTCFLLKKDGKVWYWGDSSSGSNGMGNNTTVNIPTLHDNLNALPSGIKEIGSRTDSHPKCAITNDGKLYTWGYNTDGALGRGNESDYTSQGPWLVSTQSSNTFTRCGVGYYCNYALQDNGYLWSCGNNSRYELGDGTNTDRNTFIRVDLANVIDFQAEHNGCIAVTSTSNVYMWGTQGESYMSDLGTQASPTELTSLIGKNIVKVRSSANTGYAISSDGKLYAWGNGGNYELPSGSTNDITTPTEMTWFSRKNIKVVDVVPGHGPSTAYFALDDQGNMYIWGQDGQGTIGDGSGDVTNYSVPFLLKENISSMASGKHAAGCIDKFGQVYTWGHAGNGQQNWIYGADSDTNIDLPTSNNLSVGSSVLYDGSDRYVFGKGSTTTSNVTYGSNTVSLGTNSEVFLAEPHTYKFKIMDTDSVTYTSNVVSSTPARPTGRVYPPKSGTHKDLSLTASANTDNTWTIDGALYGNGAYKASMSQTANHLNQCPYRAFTGTIDYSSAHTQNNVQTSDFRLHMPQKIKLTKYAIYSRNYTGDKDQSPKDWKVYGSNDGTDWTELDSQTNQTVSTWGDELDFLDTKREYTVTGNTKYFSSYKFDVTANNGNAYLVISQIEYYGDEEGFLSDDGFGKLTLDVKGDTNATSNITFHSNTFVMGAARDLYIKDTGEYSANIYGSSKSFLGEQTYTVSANATELVWKSNEDQILYGSDIEASDSFGYGIGVHGDYAIVGAYGDDTTATDSGAAYIFYKSGGNWTQQALLKASDAASYDEFGLSVDISSDYIISGANSGSQRPGSAYIFKRSGTTWSQQAKLQASDGATGDRFGRAVSISGDYAVVGAYNDESGAGSAYTFKKDTGAETWSQQTKLTASDAAASDYFGYDVTISGDYVAVGAAGEDTTASNAGSVYIFKRSGVSWSQQQKIQASDAEADDSFGGGAGRGISLSGDYLAVGARTEDTGGSQAGSVYIFKRTSGTETWGQQQKIQASDVSANSQFGMAVSLSGDVLAVGANAEDTAASDAGAAYIFERSGTTWTEVKKITASDTQASDYFGEFISTDGTTTVVGAWGEDTKGSGAGAAYVFEKALAVVPTLTFDGYNKLSIDNVVSGVATWPSTNVTSFTGTGVWSSTTWTHDASQNNKNGYTNVFFEGTGSTTKGVEFRAVGATTELHTNTDDNTDDPGFFRIGSGANVQSGVIQANDVVTLVRYTTHPWTDPANLPSVPTTDVLTFTVTNSMLFSGGTDIVPTYTIKKDDAAFATTTSNTVYIHETGTYTAEVKNYNEYVTEVSKVVSGSITQKLAYKSTVQKIIPTNDGTVSDNDKYAFPGISGNGLVMVVVGPYDDDTTANSGGFMVYEKVDGVWTFTQQITGVGTGSNTFGYSEEGKAVQLDYAGTRVFIGDWHSNHTVAYGGSVYIYRRVAKGNWTLEQRIDSQASPQALELGFNDVNNDGDKLIIGSFGTYNSSTDEGRAWYYTRSGTTWSLQAQLASPDGAQTKYGSSIGMNSAGTRVAIGAQKYSSNTGRVYIWNYDSTSDPPIWSHDATLTGDTSSQFGWDVDMSNDGNTIVVSARGNDKVYIYDTTNGTSWTLTKEYSGYTNISSVQISGDGTTVVAGDPEGGSTQTGYSYVYIKSNGSWPSSHDKRIDSDRTSAYNGIALAISDTGDIISGAIGDNEGGTGHGAVYVYEKEISGPTLTYDGKNKLTIGGSNYADTSKVTKRGGTTYDIGTAKTMYIKETGDYDLEVSGSDKFAAVTVNVGSIDLAGATTKPIDFDGFNKLTLVNAGANAVSNVTISGTKIELGSATSYYIKDTGTYALEMSGSNVFALSSNVVPTFDHTFIVAPTISSITFPGGGWEGGTWVNDSAQDVNNNDMIMKVFESNAGSSSSTRGWCFVYYKTGSKAGKQFINVNLPDPDNNTGVSPGGIKRIRSGVTTGSQSTDELEYATGDTIEFYNTPGTGYDVALAIFTVDNSMNFKTAAAYITEFHPGLTFDGNNKLSVSNFITSSVEFTDAAITGTAYYAGSMAWSSDNKLTSSAANGWVKGRARTTTKFNKSTIAGIQFRVSRTADYWNVQILTPDDTETWMTSSTDDVILANQKPFISNQNGGQGYNVYSGGYSAVKSGSYVQTDLLKIYFDESKIYSYKNGTLLWENAVDSYYTSNSEFYIVFGNTNASTYGQGNVYDFEFVDSSGAVVATNIRVGTLTDPSGSVHTLGQTQDTFYIRDTGNYTLDVKNDDQKAIVTKTVSGTLSASPGTPSMTNFFVWRDNGVDYTEASPFTAANSAFEDIFVNGSVATREIDGANGSGIGFSMDIHFSQTFTVNTAVFKMDSTYSTYKDLSFRCGASDSSYITVDPGTLQYSSKQTITFTFSSPITVNKLYFAVVQDGGSDLYNLRFANGDIIINDLAYPLADSDKVLPSPVLNFDTYNKLSFKYTDSDATSNIDFFSNTYEMGSRKELIINDAGTYYANIHSSNTLALVKKQVSTVTNFNSYTNTKGVHVGSQVNTAYYAKTSSTFSNDILIGDKNYSVSYWINITASALSQSESAHIWWGNNSANDVMRLGFNTNSGKKTLSLQNNSCQGNIEITPDVWHHIVIARQSSPASWISYVDGVKDDMGDGSQGDVSSNREMYIGYTTVDGGVGYIHEAYMDDISIWNKTLTQSDVDSIYGAGPSNLNSHASATNLMAWWKFEDNGNDSATGSSNNLTINNTGWYSSSAVAKKPAPSLTFDGYNKLTLENFDSVREWPPSDGTRSSVTRTNSNKTTVWTISGASYGNGEYTAETDDDVWASGSHLGYPDVAFNKSTTLPTTQSGFITNNSPMPVELRITLPNAIVLGSYKLQGRAYNDTQETPGTWTMEGSNDGTTWTVIDTQTATNPALDNSKTATYTVSGNSTAYNRYKLNITATNVAGGGATILGELYLYSNDLNASITKGSDSYDIGTASSIYIDAAGTYDAQAKNSNTFMIKTSKVVSAIASKLDYTNIWAGERAGMVVDSDGKLYTWGENGNNQSGRGAQDRNPTHLSTISDPVSNVWVEGAPGRTRIVKTSTDKWYMWGMNHDGSASMNKIFGETAEQSTPVDVTSHFTTHFGAQGTSDTTRIIKVVMGSTACSALAADGKVWSWGVDGNNNELGKNTTNGTASTPFKNTTNGSAELSNITDIRSLHYGKLALDSNGDVWQWGRLRTGSTGYATKQTGLDSITIIGIGSGFFTAYAWDAAGNIYSIGQGTEGQLGNGASSDQDSTWQTVTTLQGKTIHGIYGAGYSVFAHTSDGVYACGQGSNGRLGMGNTSDLNVFTKSTALSALSIYKIDFGHGPGYIITTDGKGYALGYDASNSIPTPLSGDKNVPTEASSLTNLSLVYNPPPVITYDGSNKYSIEGVTAPTTNLTFGSVTTNIGSAKDVYIRDAGTYSFHTNDGNQALLMSNVVSSTPSGTTYDDSHNQITNIGLNKEIDSVSGYLGQYTHGSTTDSEVTNNLDFTKTILTNGYPTDFSVLGQNIVRGSQTLETGQWHSNNTTSPYFRINLEKDHFVDNCVLHRTSTTSTRYSNVRFQLLDSSETQIKEVDVGGFGATDTFVTADCKVSGVRYVKVVTTTTSYTHYDEIRINGYVSTLLDVSGTTPSQVYDTSNTFTVSNIPSTQTGITGKIYKGATAYTIHATEPTSNVVIKNTGSYLSVFTTASTAYLTNAVTVSSTPDVGTNTIEDSDSAPDISVVGTPQTVAFHQGTFSDGGDPYSHGSITAAATAGYVYSDTAAGTYTWGTLTSGTDTASTGAPQNLDFVAAYTTYVWTPKSALTECRTLVVAGGGGGGEDTGGGGGAGGFLEATGLSISGQQTIIVGGGGNGTRVSYGSAYAGGDGGDSSISGTSQTAIGGGGGGSTHHTDTASRRNGRPGGSGGGGSGRGDNGGSVGGAGTAGQGYDGASSTSSYYCCGGGGASEAGTWANNSSSQSDGGDGKSSDILGTTYWWSGGGGGAEHDNQRGSGGKGGGGVGSYSGNNRGGSATPDTNGVSDAEAQPGSAGNWHQRGGNAGKHTGGGGGGGSHHDAGGGGHGGSGMVVIEGRGTTYIPGIPGSTAIADPEPVADAPSVTLDATTEVATPTMNLNFTTDLTSFPKTIGRYNISTHDTLGVVFDRTATRKKRVTKTINTDKFSMALTANNIVSESSTALPVTVSGGKFSISGSETPVLTLIRGKTYVFDQSDSTNGTHPLRLSTTSNGTHGGGSQYTSGWTTSGTPGSSNATRTLAVASDAPDTLYYYCQNHPGMGGTINVITHNLVTFGNFTLYANATVSGEHTITTNFDGTTSNVYVDGDLITSASTSVTSGAKLLTLGQNYSGRIKDFKFWNKPISYHGITVAFHYFPFASGGDPYSDGSITAAATAGHVYSDTAAGTYTWGTLGSASTVSQQAVYTWTPISGSFGGNILMVAGGGGGAMADNGNGGGGGGGAGGLVYNASVFLSGEQTIKVGGPNSAITNNGADTEFTGLTKAIGGGKGSGGGGGGASGGSGGGGFRAETGYAGTAGQGYAGGDGNSSGGNNQGGSGGGGAGGAGAGANGANGANGGVGLDYSSVFGTAYGDSGWFASGGGGGFHSGSPGTASNGGGGAGGSSGGSAGGQGQKHTGGGGGGGSIAASDNNGSYGGSGIVLIKY